MAGRSTTATNLMTIGDWCITQDTAFKDPGIYADHINSCRNDGDPITPGDCCWAADDDKSEDGKAKCYYCKKLVPPEIQALVLLQMKL